MGTTSNYSWPYPESTDPVADGAVDIQALADAADTTGRAIELATVQRFADATARNTALSGIEVEGMFAFLQDTDVLTYWDGAAWQEFSTGPGTANFTDSPTGTYSSGGKSYKYITFNASGTLTVDVAGLADILVIAGGGGGGVSAPGGGGAGGYVAETVYLQATTHNVTVGAGGATRTDGSDSNVGPFAAAGGGTGADSLPTAAGIGGSAGGGRQSSTVPAQPLYGGAQGNAGGVGNGGGGGAGGAGYDGFGAGVGLPNGGLGGAGLASSITNTSVTRASGGSAYYDAPGATRSAPVAGGGGGSGKLNGDANSGGGGAADGGLGGSGVVIVRVEV